MTESRHGALLRVASTLFACSSLVLGAGAAPAAFHATFAQTPGEGALPAEVVGSWRLVEIASMDDSVYQPDDPDRYTLDLISDGSMSVRADCNRGRGSWTSEGAGQTQFGRIAATQALCPPESLHDRYMAQFEWIRSYVLEDGHLFLATMADGAIVELEPLSEPVARVLGGEPVRTTNARETISAVLTPLLDRFAAERGIGVEEGEIEAFVANLDRVRSEDRASRQQRLAEIERQLEDSALAASEREDLEAERDRQVAFLGSLESEEDLSPEEVAEVRSMRRDMAQAIVRQWKVNRALYREYGGRIIHQQMGPEPLDAYRRFLEEQQEAGAFELLREDLAAEFWRYFTDDSRHDFYESGSEAEGCAFEAPPWETAEN